MASDKGEWSTLYCLSRGVSFGASKDPIISDPSLFLCPVCTSITAAGDRGGLFGAGGRFKGGVDPIMEKFNESIGFDKRYVCQL